MGTIAVVNHLTLDGVTQGLGRPDEDTRGGFAHGGWGAHYADATLGETLATGMATTVALLFGRRTYADFASYWPSRRDGNPYTAVLDATRKYVVSQSLTEPLAWQNSTLLSGDVAVTVPELKRSVEGSICVLGSGRLVRSLVEYDLVDEYVLVINPVILGQGQRLFADRAPRRDLALVDTVTTPAGVIVATYRARPSGAADDDSAADQN